MQKTIVSDTSCLILLHRIGQISLLRSLFGELTVTETIALEWGCKLPNFIKVENPVNKVSQKILEGFLDIGEASVIALALEKENCLLIIDEKKGLISSISEILDKVGETDFRIAEHLIIEAKRRCDE